MNPLLTAVLLLSLAAGLRAQPAAVFALDPQSPAGLRALFRPDGARLPLVSAHRGGAGPGLPENCLATFAATVGATWAMLEIDLRRTKDGAIVLMHDATLDRTSNGTGPVAARTLAELRSLRLKDSKGQLTDHGIPTLDEAITWARGKALLVLDRKEVPAAEVAKIVTAHRAEGHVLVMTYAIKDVTDCHAVNPEIMMEVMMGTRAKFEEFDRSGVPWANIVAFVGHTAKPDPELCRLIREKGAATLAGTSRNLDRPLLEGRIATLEPQRADYVAVLESGAAFIETDLPRELGPLLNAARPPTGPKAKFFHRR
jgi:glycerophosphoryl diester phosphodiesterase